MSPTEEFVHGFNRFLSGAGFSTDIEPRNIPRSLTWRQGYELCYNEYSSIRRTADAVGRANYDYENPFRPSTWRYITYGVAYNCGKEDFVHFDGDGKY